MSNRLEHVDDAVVALLKQRIVEQGAKSVALDLGISIQSLYRVTSALPVTNHLAALLQQQLGKAQL